MTLIGHGWTLADAERIAGRAARDHPSALLSHADRREAASDAVTEVILTASSAPGLPDLLRAASDAISRAVIAEKHHHGISARTSETAPRFARYWEQLPLPFEDMLVEEIAVRQVLDGLLPSHRRVLEALAEADSNDAAAEILGVAQRYTYLSRLSKARAAARELWFAPETAPGMWGADRRGGTARSRPATRCVKTRSRDRRMAAVRAQAPEPGTGGEQTNAA